MFIQSNYFKAVISSNDNLISFVFLLTLHLCSSQLHLIVLCFESLVIRLKVAILCLNSLIRSEQ